MFGVCAGVLCGYSMKECGRIVAVEVEVCGWFAVCGLRLRCERVFFVCELQCTGLGADCGTRLGGKRWVCSVSCSVLITV